MHYTTYSYHVFTASCWLLWLKESAFSHSNFACPFLSAAATIIKHKKVCVLSQLSMEVLFFGLLWILLSGNVPQIKHYGNDHTTAKVDCNWVEKIEICSWLFGHTIIILWRKIKGRKSDFDNCFQITFAILSSFGHLWHVSCSDQHFHTQLQTMSCTIF